MAMDMDSMDGILKDCKDNICVHDDVKNLLLFIVSHIITIQSYIEKKKMSPLLWQYYCVRHRMEMFFHSNILEDRAIKSICLMALSLGLFLWAS